MAFSQLVNAAAGGSGADGPVTTSGIDTTGADLLVIVASHYDGDSGLTISDSKSNTWTPLTTQDGTNAECQIYYCIGGTVGSGHTFTIDGTSIYGTISVSAFSAEGTVTFDDESGLTNTSTAIQPGSITPAGDNELFVTGLTLDASNTMSVGSSFTITDQTNYSAAQHMGGALAYKIQTTGGAENPQWSWSSSCNAASVMAVFIDSGGADTTPPSLSGATATVTGDTTADGAVTTDEGNGTLYAVVTTSATQPSAAQVKAGQDHTGSAAVFDDSQAVGSTGEKTFNGTGLTANTTYYWHFMHEDAATNQSTVASTSAFITRNLILVTDGDWFFSPYNWYKSGSTYAETVNTGAYFKTKFTGTSVHLNVDVTPQTGGSLPSGDYPTIIYSVDNAAWTRYQLTSSDTVLTLGSSLSDTTHTLEVIFVGVDYTGFDKWTTPVLCLRVTGLEVDGGDDVTTPTTYSNRMICYADSHAEGWEILGTGVTVANMDASQAFPLILGRAFEAEVGVVAFAAQGYTVAVGGSTNIPDLEDAWDFIYTTNSRLSGGSFADGDPDYIVSGHGDNDSDNGAVATAVENLIGAWRTAAPNAAIYLILPPNLTVETGIRNGHTNAADDNSQVIDFAENFLVGKTQNGTHLNIRGHVLYAAAATKLIQEPDVAAVAEAVWTYGNRTLTA